MWRVVPIQVDELNQRLFQACWKNDYEALEQLLQQGASPNAVTARGSTPLTIAVREGNCRAVCLLLKRGAHVDARGSFGLTPLILSCILGTYELAHLLLGKGADVNAKDGRGNTALWWAIHTGHRRLSGLLISRGAAALRFQPVGLDKTRTHRSFERMLCPMGHLSE